MPRKDGKAIPLDQKFSQGAESRLKRAAKAMDQIDQRWPENPYDGTSEEIRQCIKSLYIAAEALTELLVYRMFLGVDRGGK